MYEMSCKQCRKDMMRYFDREMNGKELDDLNLHLDSCESCRSLYEDLHGILGNMESVAVHELPEPPPCLELKVMEQIRALNTVNNHTDHSLRRFAKYSLPFSFVAMLFIGLSFASADPFQSIKAVLEYISTVTGILSVLHDIFHIISQSNAVAQMLNQIQFFFMVTIFMGALYIIKICVGLTQNPVMTEKVK